MFILQHTWLIQFHHSYDISETKLSFELENEIKFVQIYNKFFDNIGFDFFNQLLRLGYVIRDKRKKMATNVINRFEEGLTFMVAFVSQASGFLPENKRIRLEDQLYIMLEGLKGQLSYFVYK